MYQNTTTKNCEEAELGRGLCLPFSGSKSWRAAPDQRQGGVSPGGLWVCADRHGSIDTSGGSLPPQDVIRNMENTRLVFIFLSFFSCYVMWTLSESRPIL